VMATTQPLKKKKGKKERKKGNTKEENINN
jgi:hypothetical protein